MRPVFIGPFVGMVLLAAPALAQKIPIEVQVEVNEVDNAKAASLGVDWIDSVVLQEASPAGVVSLGSVARLTGLKADLHYLMEEGAAQLLANPNLVTDSGTDATFHAGGEIPYITSSSLGTTHVEFKSYGVTLAVRPTLQADARDGWQFRDGRLEFFGGGGPWSEAAKHELRCSAGFEPTATRLRAEVDLVLPPVAIGTRFWVFELRGVACVLVVTADDVAHAALVEGDVRDEANVQAAFVRAIGEAAVPSKDSRPVMVPGAVHRLTLELEATSQRTSARVRMLFEGLVLMSERRPQMDPDRAPTFAVYPRQEVAIQRLLVRASGL